MSVQDKPSLQTRLITWLGAGCLMLTACQAVCGSWEGVLQDGRKILVDPQTNRAIIQSGAGAGTPLWDGVHSLRDGSVIDIRSGLMVPNEEVMSLRRPQQPVIRAAPQLDPVCGDLVIKTCGLQAECGENEACELAKQLRTTQWQAASDGQDGVEWSTSHCKSALGDDEMFPACAAARPLLTTPCRRLVERLCGQTERCAVSEACQLSQELARLEETQQSDAAKETRPAHRRQCEDLLIQHAFFPPCR
jgi:hypothetical protein